jgi:predicted RNA-binding Zn-ribbon protein involved in translation (DUF1610 family)
MAHDNKQTSASDSGVVITDRDIVFDCPKCGGELVVDRDGEGMQLNCVHCGAPVLVPKQEEKKSGSTPVVGATPEPSQITNPAPKPTTKKLTFDFSKLSLDEAQKRVADLKLQLKENDSQRVETRGHVNRTMLQLHRFQMQLERLVNRQSEIEQEIEALDALSKRKG